MRLASFRCLDGTARGDRHAPRLIIQWRMTLTSFDDNGAPAQRWLNDHLRVGSLRCPRSWCRMRIFGDGGERCGGYSPGRGTPAWIWWSWGSIGVAGRCTLVRSALSLVGADRTSTRLGPWPGCLVWQSSFLPSAAGVDFVVHGCRLKHLRRRVAGSESSRSVPGRSMRVRARTCITQPDRTMERHFTHQGRCTAFIVCKRTRPLHG